MKELDNTIQNLLGEAGLSHSEVAVYLATTKAGDSSKTLIGRTHIPRPTVMAALKALKGYGLCETHRRDGRSLLYSMQPVSNLTAGLGQKARQLDELMDKLSTVDQTDTDGITTTEVNGQVEVQKLLELALRCKSRQWQIISPYNNALRAMPKAYQNYFKKVRSERQITSQTLWEPEIKGRGALLQDVLMRKPRFVPSNVAKNIPSMLLAFDNKLLAIDGTSNPSGVIIQNQSIVKTFQIVFELAWRSLKS